MSNEDLFPIGRYQAEVVDATVVESKNERQTKSAALSFKITEGPLMDRTPPLYFGALTDAALEWTVQALEAAGWDGKDITELGSCVGTKCQITVQHEEYMGKVNAKVRFINKIGIGGKRLEGAAKESFADEMRAKIAALRAGSSADEDVPFEV